MQGVDLALLVNTAHEGVVRRIHVQPHDIGQLLDEGGIRRQREGADTVRLQAMRDPDPMDRRWAAAIDRRRHCVARGGARCRVASTTGCSRAAVICRFRPRPGASRRNASGPAAANRRRHNRTVSWLVSSCRATCGLGIPRAASKTIRLRKTNRCGVVPARTQRSNVARCSSVSSNTATRFMGRKVPNLPPTYK